jgi:hypothetical protein
VRGDEGISGKDDAEQVVAADGYVLWRFDLPVAVAEHTETGVRRSNRAIGRAG